MSSEARDARPYGGAGTVGPIPTVLSFLLVLALALLANRVTHASKVWLGRELLEYPLWAVSLGLAGNLAISATGVRERLSAAFRTEFFLKTGLVLMGATINFADILRIGAKGVVQAVVVVTAVFFFTWYLSGWFGLESKLRALMAASVSICGVSAAIAAAGAVLAKKEHLVYVATLVIVFALPLMLIQPYAAKAMGLTPDVAGAWIGGNIDTTAAVVGAGAIHSEAAMQVASVVKLSQNALIGFAAFFLALYWVLVIERQPDRKPHPRDIWTRFPKFVLGFLVASLVATLGIITPDQVKTAIVPLRNWFLTAAFVCIGLELAFGEFTKVGWKPVMVYFLATLANTALALGVAW
ncbi:MAG: putative sulfate exporter family transporter, partial [Nitrospirae bacterium]|nr:putative sulfate exporter family transporter [Nitrospirota bacterium]